MLGCPNSMPMFFQCWFQHTKRHTHTERERERERERKWNTEPLVSILIWSMPKRQMSPVQLHHDSSFSFHFILSSIFFLSVCRMSIILSQMMPYSLSLSLPPSPPLFICSFCFYFHSATGRKKLSIAITEIKVRWLGWHQTSNGTVQHNTPVDTIIIMDWISFILSSSSFSQLFLYLISSHSSILCVWVKYIGKLI